MVTRDKLSTEENFLSLIKLQDEFINDCKDEIFLLENSESKGIQLYNLPNSEVIQNKYETILTYEYDNLIAEYSMGENIECILTRYVEIVSLMEIAWKKENGYIVSNLQEITLNKLYKPNLTASPEKVADIAKNKARAKVINHINNTCFSCSRKAAYCSNTWIIHFKAAFY